MIFEYNTKDNSGEDKKGQIEAQNQSEAIAKLQEQGLIIISVNPIGVKKCPYCAEEIKEEAIICRFCGNDLKTGKPKEIQARSKIEDGVNIGCGMFIVLPLIIIGLCLLPFIVVGLAKSPAVLVVVFIILICYFGLYIANKIKKNYPR